MFKFILFFTAAIFSVIALGGLALLAIVPAALLILLIDRKQRG